MYPQQPVDYSGLIQQLQAQQAQQQQLYQQQMQQRLYGQQPGMPPNMPVPPQPQTQSEPTQPDLPKVFSVETQAEAEAYPVDEGGLVLLLQRDGDYIYAKRHNKADWKTEFAKYKKEVTETNDTSLNVVPESNNTLDKLITDVEDMKAILGDLAKVMPDFTKLMEDFTKNVKPSSETSPVLGDIPAVDESKQKKRGNKG